MIKEDLDVRDAEMALAGTRLDFRDAENDEDRQDAKDEIARCKLELEAAYERQARRKIR